MEIDNIKPLFEKLKEVQYWLDGAVSHLSLDSNINISHVAAIDEAIDIIETYHQQLNNGGTNNGSI